MWDLEASSTAVREARTLVTLAADPELALLLPPGAARQNERLLTLAGLWKPWHDRVTRSRLFQRLMHRLDRNANDGTAVQIAVRKRFLEDEAEDALSNGAVQLAVIGGGYDTLALRLAALHPAAPCLHVDRPAIIDVLSRALDASGDAPSNLRLVALDAVEEGHQDLAGALPGIASWVPDKRAMIVCERSFVVMPHDVAGSLLDQLRTMCGAQSRLAFGYVRAASEGARIGRRLGPMTRAALALAAEPSRYSFEPGELEALLAARGFRAIDALDGARFDLGRRYLEPAGLGHHRVAADERVAVAELAPREPV